MLDIAYRYVEKNTEFMNGEPVIRGTKTTVRTIVEMWRSGILPEEMPARLPHLTLAQVFDALSYFADNQEEINQFIILNRVPDNLVHPAA